MKTNRSLLMQLTLNGALAVLAHAAFAQTWQTVDDAYVGDGAYALCMAKDPFGNIYAGGSIGDTNSNYLNQAAVRKSSDGGVTWATGGIVLICIARLER